MSKLASDLAQKINRRSWVDTEELDEMGRQVFEKAREAIAVKMENIAKRLEWPLPEIAQAHNIRELARVIRATTYQEIELTEGESK